MMTDLSANKVVVITEAVSGIGCGIALAFARHGARAAFVADIREEPREGGKPTHEAIQAETRTLALFVTCDVTNLDNLETTIEAAETPGSIDILCQSVSSLLVL